MLSAAQKQSPLFEILTREVNHRYFVGLLTILIVLLHLQAIVWLLQLTKTDKVIKPLKVIEVALLSGPNPKAATSLSTPSKPAPPKKIPPKKKVAKPTIKKQDPVTQKPTERPKPQPLIDAQTPAHPSLNDFVQKKETPISALQPDVNKSAGKTVTGEVPSKAFSSGVVPLMRVQPKYPMRAANRHIEGWVKIEFTVSTTGNVTDAVVVDSEPTDVFDDAAMDAIMKWKFKQKIVDGKAVTQRAVQVLKFKLIN